MLVLHGHTNSVQALAYTPDGSTLVSAGDDCTIRLWDWRNAEVSNRLGDHTGAVLTIAVSPGGRWLASGGHDKEVRLWDLTSPDSPTRLERFARSVNAVAFSPDERLLAYGAEYHFNSPNSLRILNIKTDDARTLKSSLGGSSGIWSLAFAADGTFAAGWSSGIVSLYHSDAFDPPFAQMSHQSAPTALAFSPDCSTLAALSSNTVFVWDVPTARLLRILGTHGGRTTSVCFTPDGRYLVTGGWDATVRMWDVETGREMRRFDWELGVRINAVAIAPDGMTAAAAGDAHDIVIWDIDD